MKTKLVIAEPGEMQKHLKGVPGSYIEMYAEDIFAADQLKKMAEAAEAYFGKEILYLRMTEQEELQELKSEFAPAQQEEPRITEEEQTNRFLKTMEEAAEKSRKRAPTLDRGKIKALHDAGWKVNKIADEMGCAPNSIYHVLQSLEKEQEGQGDV